MSDSPKSVECTIPVPAVRHYLKVTLAASEKFAGCPIGWRCQYWKYQVSPRDRRSRSVVAFGVRVHE